MDKFDGMKTVAILLDRSNYGYIWIYENLDKGRPHLSMNTAKQCAVSLEIVEGHRVLLTDSGKVVVATINQPAHACNWEVL